MRHPAIILYAMLLCLLATACSNDDEPADIDVVGSWNITEQSRDEGQTWEDWTPVPTVMVFHADGRFYTDGYFGEYNGRWTRQDNVVTATTTAGDLLRFKFETISGTTAEIKITTLYGSLLVRAVRQ